MPRLPPRLVPDEQLRHLEETKWTDPRVGSWFRTLLEERRYLIGVVLRLGRQVRYLRKRTKAAAAYLDGVADKVEETAREPWPGQIACEQCGGPVIQVSGGDPASGGGAETHHPDGHRCRAPVVLPNGRSTPVTRQR